MNNMDNDKVIVGFNETKEALTFVFAVAKGVQDSLGDDGKFTITDLPKFLPALLALKDAYQGAENIPLEFKMANQEEADELKLWVKDTFDIADDQVEKAIEDAFAVVLDLWIVINTYLIKGDGSEAVKQSPVNG